MPKVAKIESAIERDLVSFLAELSALLIDCGYTAGTFGDLAKKSFVEAASRLSRLGNGRVNRSRVAAITGLTRTEVKRILAESVGRATKTPRSQHRALRVLTGWRSDSDFTSEKGVPRTLSLVGKKAPFAELVRRYSGDMPTRVILEELVRLGLIAVTGSKAKIKTDIRPPAAALQLASSLLTALTTVSADLGGSDLVPVRVLTREVHAVSDDLGTKLLRRRTHENVKAFVTAMQEAARSNYARTPRLTSTSDLRKTRVTIVVSESRNKSNKRSKQ